MKVVIAIDSLKGSLSSLEAGEAIHAGIERVFPKAQVIVRPLADGGEGTVEALTLGLSGKLEKVIVSDPLGRPVEAVYGILPNGKTAIIEMSAAAGITLVKEAERNPLHTTTYGVGEMIRHGVEKGCRSFLVGIGGSATNDGGVGMLQALGFGFLNEQGKQISFGAKGLANLKKITTDQVIPQLQECSFKIACDVTNPLCGKKGASAVYGPQKGATLEMVEKMDHWLSAYAALAEKTFGKGYSQFPGTGAAGGLGFAFLTFTNAVLQSGVQIVLEETRLEKDIKDADLVITGEGRLDSQTIMGKAPIGVAKLAKKYDKKVIAFSGCVTEDAALCNQHGIDAFFPILRSVVSLEDAMEKENARKNMTDTVEQVMRLLQI
ncbi:MAG: glycerate kinase [Lachnospiraceae bacterium]|nr:glycerate kinase [Lachnospiraceae bacterium]